MQNLSQSNIYKSLTLKIEPTEKNFIPDAKSQLEERIETFSIKIMEQHRNNISPDAFDVKWGKKWQEHENSINKALKKYIDKFVPAYYERKL